MCAKSGWKLSRALDTESSLVSSVVKTFHGVSYGVNCSLSQPCMCVSVLEVPSSGEKKMPFKIIVTYVF